MYVKFVVIRVRAVCHFLTKCDNLERFEVSENIGQLKGGIICTPLEGGVQFVPYPISLHRQNLTNTVNQTNF